MKKKKIISLLIYILIPLVLGAIVGFLSGSNDGYKEFIKPDFAPPGIVFPIVWSILYILMGISAFIVASSNSLYRNIALKNYYIQLTLNLLWSFIFFKFKLLLLSSIWILVLIYFVIQMIKYFYRAKKIAGILQSPYLLWLIFAFILSITIYIIN